MRCAASIVLLLMGLGMPLPLSASLKDQILIKGQSTTLSVEYDIGDVAVGDQEVCDYLVGQERHSIYLNAKGRGETTITLWDVDGSQRDEFSMRVVTTTLKEMLDRVKQDFGDLNGVNIEIRDGHVEIDGEIVDPEDFREVEAMAKSDPKLRSRVRLAKDIIAKIEEAIRDAIEIPGITVESVRDKIILGGVSYNASDKQRALEIAKLYYPEVLDLIDLKETGRAAGRGELIELDIHMMEIKRSALRQLGVNWAPGSLSSGGSSNAGIGGGAGFLSSIGDVGRSLMGFVFQLIPKLKTISERGEGRVLENPSIIVKSGEKAKIFSGSEVPYYRNDEVQFKKVGIEIEAEPIKFDDGVDLKISATLSAPSADIRGAVDTHTVSTTAICSFGQSLALGNIVRNGDVKMKNRVPQNVDTSSALFTLFLSKDFQSNRSEFVIFVTPKLVKKPTPSEMRLKQFFATEEAMILDRSKAEYEKYMKDHGADISKDRRPKQKRTNRYSREGR